MSIIRYLKISLPTVAYATAILMSAGALGELIIRLTGGVLAEQDVQVATIERADLQLAPRGIHAESVLLDAPLLALGRDGPLPQFLGGEDQGPAACADERLAAGLVPLGPWTE